MEPRGQAKETGLANSRGYNHHQLNLEEETNKQTRQDSVPDPSATPTRSISISPPPPPRTTTIRYRECVRNHAASMGGYVVDGCGEFMPSGEEGNPKAMKCAACECHRNFHRREIDGETQQTSNHCNNTYRRTSFPSPLQLPNSFPPPPPHHQHSHGMPMGGITTSATITAAPVMMSFGGGAAAESSSEDLYQSNVHLHQEAAMSKKRFRTKFTHQQKERMMEFAEKLGWRIQKQDEEEVQQFCSQVSVKRKVFKVWMHNNKQTIKKKQM